MSSVKFSKEEALLYRAQGMTYPEIAQVMGCSEAWVKKTLQGQPKGNNRVAVDGTKIKAIEILEKALAELRGL